MPYPYIQLSQKSCWDYTVPEEQHSGEDLPSQMNFKFPWLVRDAENIAGKLLDSQSSHQSPSKDFPVCMAQKDLRETKRTRWPNKRRRSNIRLCMLHQAMASHRLRYVRQDAQQINGQCSLRRPPRLSKFGVSVACMLGLSPGYFKDMLVLPSL